MKQLLKRSELRSPQSPQTFQSSGVKNKFTLSASYLHKSNYAVLRWFISALYKKDFIASIKRGLFVGMVSVFLISQSLLFGKDFGLQGELFTIQEENILSVLQKQLSQKLPTSTLESALQKLQTSIKNPTSPLVPKEASTYKTYYYDPTFVVTESITDQKGKILFPKGTKVNPLQSITLPEGLLFFDGENPRHLQWAKAHPAPFKWILVHGNPFKLEEEEKRPVYFDQQGFSVSKFGLQHIPARVTQEGLRLKIEEMPPHNLGPSS